MKSNKIYLLLLLIPFYPSAFVGQNKLISQNNLGISSSNNKVCFMNKGSIKLTNDLHENKYFSSNFLFVGVG